MRVLFDAYWLYDGPPSGRNVLRSFVSSWAAAFPEDDLVLAVPSTDLARTAADTSFGPKVGYTPISGGPHGLSVLTRLRPGGFDAVISQNFAPLRGGAVKAVFVHDVIFRRHPKWFTFVERCYLRVSLLSLRTADLILTSSQSEAKQIVSEVSSRLRPNVVPVGLALSPEFENAVPATPAGFERNTKFILVVGRLNIRKNVLFCAESLLSAKIISPSFPLVIVGQEDGRAEDFDGIEQAVRDGSVRFTSYISDEELKWLYSNTELFIFPSLDEGFGLPILEATSCGARTVLSDIPPFRELVPHGSFFDPTDAAALQNIVRDVLQQPPARVVSSPSHSWLTVASQSRRAIEVQLRKAN